MRRIIDVLAMLVDGKFERVDEVELRQVFRCGQCGEHVSTLQRPLEDRVWMALRGRPSSALGAVGLLLELVQIGRRPLTDEIDERGGDQGHVAGELVSEEEPSEGEKSACYSGPSDVQDLPHAGLNRQGSWSS